MARTGSTKEYPWGDSLNGREANVDGTQPYGTQTQGPHKEVTTKVGTYPPNLWGLYDTVGNVWEWCSDVYDNDYYASSPTSDPVGPTAAPGSSRVTRGGSWRNGAVDACSSSRRLRFAFGHHYPDLGFRVVAE